MAYDPHTWVDNETITAAKLNAIESGLANAGGGPYDAYDFVVFIDENSETISLQKGSYADVGTKISDGGFVRGVVLSSYVSGDLTTQLSTDLISLSYSPGIDITMTALYPASPSPVPVFFVWPSDDNIWVD